MKNQILDKKLSDQTVPDGEERLATQAERDDVTKKIEGSDSTPDKTTGQP